MSAGIPEHAIHQAENTAYSVGNGPVRTVTLLGSWYSSPEPEPPEGHDRADPWCECGMTFDDRSEAMDHLRDERGA